MSGGYFDYDNDRAARSIFDWGVEIDYGLGDGRYYKTSVSTARKLNPLEDREISKLAFDMFCLIHSFDWYKSGDTGEEQYRKDLEYFKQKWLKPTPLQRAKAEIEKSVSELREELLKQFGAWEETDDN